MRCEVDCAAAARSASSIGNAAWTRVASWRVTNARSRADSPRANVEAPALPALLAGTGGLHIERRQLALAQQLADLARTVRLQHALLLATAGVEGEVFEGGHYSSRVTRRTSSTVVTPSSTLRRPSSRMLGPLVRACRVISCSEDSLWISERMWSSNTTSS